MMKLLASTEFWAAIAGAMVAGLITFGVQIIALRDARRQREEDRRRVQQALAHALLFKVASICKNVHAIHQHFHNCLQQAERDDFKGEPWQAVVPIVSLPEPINFTPEEMGMLLSLKDDAVFNSVMEMDIGHNSLVGGGKAYNLERIALAERLSEVSSEHSVDQRQRVGGIISREQLQKLQPKMIDANSLLEQVYSSAREYNQSFRAAAMRLNSLLRSKLGLQHKLQFLEEVP
jgi:hypothetical protein